MRIGFEGKVLTAQAGGTGRYAINLLRALLAAPSAVASDIEFVIFTGPQTTQELLHGFAGRYREQFLAAKSSLVRALALIPAALRRERIDVFHGLDHVAIPLVGKRGRYVASIHDVIPLKFPHLFTAKHRFMVRAGLARIAKQADLVIAPSQATREDILTYTPLGKDRVCVIPAGCEPQFAPEVDPERLAQVRSRYALPAHYILALGTLEPRKNLPALLQAFAELRHRRDVDPQVQLVLAGARGWKEGEIFRTCKRLGLEQTVLFPGFIAEHDLPDVYRGATCFAFPSLYEGFGFPVLEAMACGVPVLASNTSSMPEVAGDAALFVDPGDIAAMAEALYRLLYDAALRTELRRKGLIRSRLFTWDSTAQKMLDLYHSLRA
jgi:glycosyltransferase involved in cell wall biosynthesis